MADNPSQLHRPRQKTTTPSEPYNKPPNLQTPARPFAARPPVIRLALSVALTLGLTLAGWLAATRNHTSPTQPAPRLLVIGIRRFSWETVIALHTQSQLPNLATLLDGESARGDILSRDYPSEDAILASILTGRFPVHHGISADHSYTLRSISDRVAQYLPWTRIHATGRPVAAIGFPIWQPLAGRNALIIPPEFSGPGTTIYQDGEPVSGPSQWTSLKVTSTNVPSEYLTPFTSDPDLPAALRAALRAALASDLTTLALAQQAATEASHPDLFIYLSGLAALDNALAAQADPAARPALRHTLLSEYHQFIDSRIGTLHSLVADVPTALILFSEDGSRGQPMSYRPRFPTNLPPPAVGFFLATGPGIRRSVIPATLTPPDVAATLLALARATLPVALDGVVCYNLLNDDFYLRNPEHVRP